MKDKKLLYINLTLFVSLVIIVIIGKKLLMPTAREDILRVRDIADRQPRVSAKIPKPSYDISTFEAERPAALSREAPKQMRDVYNNFPKEDVGENMLDAWTMVKAADKAKFMEGLDKQIEGSKEMLNANPEDKRAKNILLISENLKRMVASDFNYNAKRER